MTSWRIGAPGARGTNTTIVSEDCAGSEVNEELVAGADVPVHEMPAHGGVDESERPAVGERVYSGVDADGESLPDQSLGSSASTKRAVSVLAGTGGAEEVAVSVVAVG